MNGVLIEKLKHYDNDDEGMKRKLLIDGDGAGENRVLNNIFKHFFQFFINCENSDAQQDNETINNLFDAIQQSELSMQYSLQKIKMVTRELENCELNYSNIEQAISEAKEKLSKCKNELEDAKRIRSYKVEYDLITKLIEEHPSTLHTQTQLNTLESEIAELQSINDKIDNKLEKRKKQFQLLLYASHQLKNTLEDEDISPSPPYMEES